LEIEGSTKCGCNEGPTRTKEKFPAIKACELDGNQAETKIKSQGVVVINDKHNHTEMKI